MPIKRLIILVLCTMMLLSISACKGGNLDYVEGTMWPVELTKEERAIIDLISVDQDFNIVKYKVSDKIDDLQIWLEGHEMGRKPEDTLMFASR